MSRVALAVHVLAAVSASLLFVGCGSGSGTTTTSAPYNGRLKWGVTAPFEDRFIFLVSKPVLVADDTLVVPASDEGLSQGFVHAFDRETGALKWSVEIARECSGTPALGADGTIFVQASDSIERMYVYALSAADGTLKWRKEFNNNNNNYPHPLSAVRPGGRPQATGHDAALGAGDDIDHDGGSPAVGADGTVFVSVMGDAGGGVYALNGSTGSVKWQYGAGQYFTSPVLADGIVVVRTRWNWPPSLHALHSGNGSHLWNTTFSMGPLYSGDAVLTLGPHSDVLVASAGFLFAVDLHNGSTKWSQTNVADPTGQGGTPVVGRDGTIVLSGIRDELPLFALDSSNGSVKWNFTVEGTILGPAAVSNEGTVYVCGMNSDNEHFFALDATDGALKWRVDMGGSNACGHDASPAVGADGTVFTAGLAWLNAFYGEGGSLAVPDDSGLAVSLV